MLVTLLGTGTSYGVPVLGCTCATCTSTDPRDQRYRSSIYVTTGGKGILIDTATELRLQAIKNKLTRVDSVLLTHNHADHICGLDDLRRFNQLQAGPIPIYGNQETLKGITNMFPYIFDDNVQVGGGKPQINLIPIDTLSLNIAGETVTPIPVLHGRVSILGYRIGDLGYLTDCSEIPTASLGLLKNLKLLILGVLRFKPHPTHLNLEAGLELIHQLKPERSILTHLAHDFKHIETNHSLPDGVELGYDGQKIEI